MQLAYAISASSIEILVNIVGRDAGGNVQTATMLRPSRIVASHNKYLLAESLVESSSWIEIRIVVSSVFNGSHYSSQWWNRSGSAAATRDVEGNLVSPIISAMDIQHGS
ncbi:12797_t:CDS:2 [Acaulospora colombiana]|uniref:12797_t:CDS:1 n=1 Tax=Acaulospora colombiana TaxID=27376 RepID=A0ACA9N4A9_9GLOM|nr:12797_t:CDS:2 [Acaulospora colombiana]